MSEEKTYGVVKVIETTSVSREYFGSKEQLEEKLELQLKRAAKHASKAPRWRDNKVVVLVEKDGKETELTVLGECGTCGKYVLSDEDSVNSLTPGHNVYHFNCEIPEQAYIDEISLCATDEGLVACATEEEEHE